MHAMRSTHACARLTYTGRCGEQYSVGPHAHVGMYATYNMPLEIAFAKKHALCMLLRITWPYASKPIFSVTSLAAYPPHSDGRSAKARTSDPIVHSC